MSIYSNPKYCVYLTVYKGNKLPPFYIGSTSIKRIQSGYKGSVKSKMYSEIFTKEIQLHPHLFKTMIIASYFSRKKAQYKEKKLHEKLNVVKSDMYINMSIAKNFGWFGMNTSKENSPVFGKTWKKTQEQKDRQRQISLVVFNTPEYKEKISSIRKGKIPRSKKQIEQKTQQYTEIFELYDSKPNLKYDYISKNGKLITYERAFAKEYCSKFNLSCNGLHDILTQPRIIKSRI
jgi:hypothetical protein